jgi:hypothetical protein
MQAPSEWLGGATRMGIDVPKGCNPGIKLSATEPNSEQLKPF